MPKDRLSIVAIHPCGVTAERRLPLYLSKVRAGFPSPADDFIDKRLDLNEFLIKHPAATFFVKVEGDSMVNAGIFSGDILIVDRSLQPANNKIIVAVLNGEFTVKRIRKSRSEDKLYLLSENPDYGPIEVTPEMDFDIWGTVAHVIHTL